MARGTAAGAGGKSPAGCSRRRAIVVYAPTLTGLADRSHLLSRETGLETHIRDIVNLLEWEELDDAVLCGHSYGGMVVTGAADRAAGRLRALVYLDAFVPADGAVPASIWRRRRASLRMRRDARRAG